MIIYKAIKILTFVNVLYYLVFPLGKCVWETTATIDQKNIAQTTVEPSVQNKFPSPIQSSEKLLQENQGSYINLSGASSEQTTNVTQLIKMFSAYSFAEPISRKAKDSGKFHEVYTMIIAMQSVL